jgi:hypothetical protein
MARKPFVDPNPNLPRRSLYGPKPKVVSPRPVALSVARKPRVGRKPDVPLIEGRVESKERVDSTLPAPMDSIMESTLESVGKIVREPVIVRLPEAAMARLDALRGDKSRSEAARTLLVKVLGGS